jgi:hypothetical protein
MFDTTLMLGFSLNVKIERCANLIGVLMIAD